MKAKYLFLIFLPLLIASCAAQTKSPDRQVDSRLGLEEKEDAQDAETTIQDLQEKQQQEQRRQLERQITDPLAG